MADDDHKPLKFGEILAPGGALFVIRGPKDVAYAHSEFLKATMIKKGITITPQIEAMIQEAATQKAADVVQRITDRGVSEVFKQLFALPKKKEVERYCKELRIDGSEFAAFIHNCGQIGFHHEKHHAETVPEELHTTDAELKAFLDNGVGVFKTKEAKKFVRKTTASFDRRKHISGHLVIKGTEWHLFWFTFEDVFAGSRGRENHWAGGDHIHYTSHLFGIDREKTWSMLTTPPYSIKGIHIAYDHNDSDNASDDS